MPFAANSAIRRARELIYSSPPGDPPAVTSAYRPLLEPLYKIPSSRSESCDFKADKQAFLPDKFANNSALLYKESIRTAFQTVAGYIAGVAAAPAYSAMAKQTVDCQVRDTWKAWACRGVSNAASSAAGFPAFDATAALAAKQNIPFPYLLASFVATAVETAVTLPPERRALQEMFGKSPATGELAALMMARGAILWLSMGMTRDAVDRYQLDATKATALSVVSGAIAAAFSTPAQNVLFKFTETGSRHLTSEAFKKNVNLLFAGLPYRAIAFSIFTVAAVIADHLTERVCPPTTPEPMPPMR
ncbi:MAG: hypothetical protein ACK5NY_03590 [Burkholderiaceae bacterium]|jgi:hypothetical protein